MTSPLARAQAIVGDMIAWRHDFHAHPETAFNETRTAALVAERLRAFGVDEVHENIARTGVVGVIRGKGGEGKAIGLRADMDALPLDERNTFSHASKAPGAMHACGHDGHTTMLLGAARLLAESRNFRGTVYAIFQPAEEGEAGGRVMIEDGLFTRFPMHAVYGMHNWPGVAEGTFAIRTGPVMASFDIFELTLEGKGGHAAMPHNARDVLVAASQLVLSLQTIVSRSIDPIAPAVVSVTQIHGGDAWNVLPQTAVVRGTVRAFDEGVQDDIEHRIHAIARGIMETFGVEVAVRYERRYPPTINSPEEAEQMTKVARALVGDENVDSTLVPSMGSEDFAFLLQKKPGAYIRMGVGMECASLHNPSYDFNDAVLPLGAAFWTALAEDILK